MEGLKILVCFLLKLKMEKEQEIEWIKAQNIGISVDLVAAAKRQLQFLAAVDRNRYLYEGSALERAIYRYNKSCRFFAL